MRHEYDDEQINDASRTAANYGSCGELHSNYLRRFLDALPEPDQQDDWKECPMFGAPEPGDRLRIRWACGDVHEGVITSRSRDNIQLDSTQVNRRDRARLEYIPAPVTPPDPALHQFIRVDGKDYEAIPESGRYQLLEPGLATVHVINRENITEWTELELVPKEVADND